MTTQIPTDDYLDLAEKVARIFMPHAMGRQQEAIDKKSRFAHYTSAENALKIIQSKQIWLRNTVCMADYSEVRHGHALLLRFFSDPGKRKLFCEALDRCAPGLAQEALNLFDAWWGHLQTSTYICSISEHRDAEDQHGRLSMWRAFGRIGVALIFRLPLASKRAVLPLNLILSPVAYFNYEQVENELVSIVGAICEQRDFLGTVKRDLLLGAVLIMLQSAAVSLKHEGFAEELEWRIIYSPKQRASPFILRSIEVVGGIPQLIYKISLEENSEAGISEIAIPQLVDRVIIGPSAFPWPIYEAFVAALDAAGVSDAASRVVVSNIPLRM